MNDWQEVSHVMLADGAAPISGDPVKWWNAERKSEEAILVAVKAWTT
jgi:redox-sensitive bicupin YhaK (pirin superfamily)